MTIALGLLTAGLLAVVVWAWISNKSLSRRIDQRIEQEKALRLRMTERAVKAAESQRENQRKADELRKATPEMDLVWHHPEQAVVFDSLLSQLTLARPMGFGDPVCIAPHLIGVGGSVGSHLSRPDIRRLLLALKETPSYRTPGERSFVVGIPTEIK